MRGSALAVRRPLCATDTDLRRGVDPAERRPVFVRLGAGFDPDPTCVQRLGSRAAVWRGITIFVNQGQTVSAVIAVAGVLAFVLFMARAPLGKSLRAAADNPEAATYMGIDVGRAHQLAFGLGVAITAIGGGLLASGTSFQPYVGLEYVIVMYAGVVLGGLGSVSGAFFGGLTIGLVQQLSTLFLPNQLQNTAIFVVFLGIVLLRPQGLFGRARADIRDGDRQPRRQALLIAAFGVAYALLTAVVGSFVLSVDHDRGAGLGGDGPGVERFERLQRSGLVRTCRVLRPRRVFRRAGANPLGTLALDRHSAARVWSAASPDWWSAFLPFVCADIISRWRCWRIRWRCCMCSNGWVTRNSRCRCSAKHRSLTCSSRITESMPGSRWR